MFPGETSSVTKWTQRGSHWLGRPRKFNLCLKVHLRGWFRATWFPLAEETGIIHLETNFRRSPVKRNLGISSAQFRTKFAQI